MRLRRAEESGGRRADEAAVELQLEMEHEHELELEMEPLPALLHGSAGHLGSR